MLGVTSVLQFNILGHVCTSVFQINAVVHVIMNHANVVKLTWKGAVNLEDACDECDGFSRMV